MATQTQTNPNQPIPQEREQDSSGFYGWVIFWVIVALVAIGAIAYAAYKPNFAPTTSGSAVTSAPADTTGVTQDNGNGPAAGTTSNMAPAANPADNTGANPAAAPNGNQPAQPNAAPAQ